MREHLDKIAVSLALAAILGGLAFYNRTQVQIALMQASLERLENDNTDIEFLKGTAGKHWRLLSWTRDQINELRTAAQPRLPITSWPEAD